MRKNMTKNKIGKKFVKRTVLAVGITGIMMTGGVLAYFTDTSSVVNTFTVGKISLELTEPGWNPENAKNLTPGKCMEKDPQITNDGKNPAFIFAEVSVPYRKIITVNADGSKNSSEKQELFTYTLNEGWTELGEVNKDEKKEVSTRLYVYGSEAQCKALEVDKKTPPIFQTITFANVIEGQELEETAQNVTVSAYGIQTTDVNGGKTSPEEVWKVLSGQTEFVRNREKTEKDEQDTTKKKE